MTIRSRRLVDHLASAAAAVCTIALLMPLALIFGYLLTKGVSALNLDFFTQLPQPVGELGGGMANAIVGSVILVALACVLGLPIGVLTGVYLAEHGRTPFGVTVRFCAD